MFSRKLKKGNFRKRKIFPTSQKLRKNAQEEKKTKEYLKRSSARTNIVISKLSQLLFVLQYRKLRGKGRFFIFLVILDMIISRSV